MTYNYLDFISENQEKYNNTLAYFFIALIISLVGLYATYSWYVSDIEEFESITSKVISIEETSIDVTSDVPYFFHKVEEPILKLNLESQSFIIKEHFRDIWSSIKRELTEGTLATVYYTNRSGKNIVRQVETSEKIVLKHSQLKHESFYALIVSSFIFIISSTVILVLYIKRKSYLKK